MVAASARRVSSVWSASHDGQLIFTESSPYPVFLFRGDGVSPALLEYGTGVTDFHCDGGEGGSGFLCTFGEVKGGVDGRAYSVDAPVFLLPRFWFGGFLFERVIHAATPNGA